MSVVHDSAYYRIETLDGYVRIVRSARPYTDLPGLDAEHAQLERALAPLRGLPVLVDLRDAPGRNDPAFEERMSAHRRVLFRGAPRACVLVRTATGVLQVRRHVKEDGLEGRVVVTNDPAGALRHVRGVADGTPY